MNIAIRLGNVFAAFLDTKLGSSLGTIAVGFICGALLVYGWSH